MNHFENLKSLRDGIHEIPVTWVLTSTKGSFVKKTPSTTKVTINYMNGQKYTIPRVEDLHLTNFKLLGRTSRKVGVCEENTSFKIGFEDVYSIYIRSKYGYADTVITFKDGDIDKVVHNQKDKFFRGLI